VDFIQLKLLIEVKMSETVLLLGSGSREHTLVWKLLQSPKIKEIFVAPGNGGIQAIKDRVKVISGKFTQIKSISP